MKPLLVLLSVFTISIFVNKVFRGDFHLLLSGRIAMSAMLLFTAIGHFVFAKGMSTMLPEFVPFKSELVYFTGIIEITAAIGLFIPNIIILTAWLLIAFFVLILPVNIYTAVNHINYQKGTLDGPGLPYLWFRIPLQFFFIAWVYVSTLKPGKN